jgi:cytochrome c553
VPNSSVALTQTQLNDKFSAPDWRPGSHPVMPEIVAHGRAPEVFACGYCHSPSGQGRPENASLAQLPAAYIVQQMADFKAGIRHSASATYAPAAGMAKLAMAASVEEVAAAAEYFSHQTLGPRVKVVESATVPRTTVVGYVYVAIPGAGEEPIGERVIEVAPDGERHEKRDDQLLYTAYVPPGSVSRGQAIATPGGSNAFACAACHGNNLQGVGLVPPLAGRSPTYILRQLVAFQTGARAGQTGQPMLAVVAPLQMRDMIDAAAYAASLSP